jgi:hypothetical protein
MMIQPKIVSVLCALCDHCDDTIKREMRHSILAAGNQNHNLIKTICRSELTILFGWMQMVIQMYERVESDIQEMRVLPILQESYCVEIGTRIKPTHLQETADAAYISLDGTLWVAHRRHCVPGK